MVLKRNVAHPGDGTDRVGSLPGHGGLIRGSHASIAHESPGNSGSESATYPADDVHQARSEAGAGDGDEA